MSNFMNGLRGYVNPEKKESKPLRERIPVRPDQDTIGIFDEIVAKHPELEETLEKISSAEYFVDQCAEILEEFNNVNMLKKEGNYNSVYINGDHGEITVKDYENGSVSISARWRK